jgi:hypothetical protein
LPEFFLSRPLAYAREANRVQMDVAGQLCQIVLRFHYDSFEPPLIQVAHPFIAPIEIPSIAPIEVPHEGGQVGAGGLDHEMEVVVHENIDVQRHLIGL